MDVNGDKYKRLFDYIDNLRMRDVRLLFARMRELQANDPNVLFPEYGFTAGEFTIAYIHNMPNRSKRPNETSK